MFGIFSENAPIEECDEMVLPSSIVINEFKENFNIPLAYWNVKDYRNSWKLSIEEGLQRGSHAVLAVSMYEPGHTNFVFTWVLYLEGENVFIQNKIIFLDEHPEFTPENINDYVENRETHDEDGRKLSEWSTDLNSIINFYHDLKN